MRKLEKKLSEVGLTLTELLQEELNGGCTTENHLKLMLIQWGRMLDSLVTGQAADHLQRLQEFELLGKNPHSESQIDIAEMALGIPSQKRINPFLD